MLKNKLKILDKEIAWTKIEVGAPENTPFILFLHEGLGSIDMWKDFPQKLCQLIGLNGIIYDRKGHGASDPINKPRSKDYMEVEALNYLPEFINQLDIKNPILFGHSDGGSIALLYASKYPVKAVITEAAHIYVEEITLQGIRAALPYLQSQTGLEKLGKYHGNKTKALIHAWADTWLADWFRDWNISEYLKDIKAPALLFQGQEDEYATDKHLEDIQKGIGENAHAFLLPNCKHIPHFQAHEKVLQACYRFLSNTDVSK